MAERGDFYEDDERIEDRMAAFARGRKVVTAPPSAVSDKSVTISSTSTDRGLEAITEYYVPPTRGSYYTMTMGQAGAVATSGDRTVIDLGSLQPSLARVSSHS